MDETIKEIRGAIFALQVRDAGRRPDPRAGIVRLVEEMTAVLGFAPSLRLGAGLRTLDSEELTEQTLAVLREALSNMARHAVASRALTSGAVVCQRVPAAVSVIYPVAESSKTRAA